jgi:hypothetical protein
MRLSSRIDAVAARVEQAIRTQQVLFDLLVEPSSDCGSLTHALRQTDSEVDGRRRQGHGLGDEVDGRGEGMHIFASCDSTAKL